MASEKLQKFRQIMREHNINAYLQPKGDAHFSEYPADFSERIKFISNFSGSYGVVLITEKEALLWTDSRYWLQAEKELDQGWELRKLQLGAQTWFQFVVEQYANKGEFVVSYDTSLLSYDNYKTRSTYFSNNGIKFEGKDTNLIDLIWTDRPAEPSAKLMVHDVQFTGQSVTERLEQVGKQTLATGASYHFVPILEQIAWVLSIRGRDNEYNPVCMSYLLLHFEKNGEQISSRGTLYVRKSKVPEEVQKHLQSFHIDIKDYNEVGGDLRGIDQKILISKTECNSFVYQTIEKQDLIINCTGESPIEKLKAVKNAREREGMRTCHVRDGAALVRYIAWLENELNVNNNTELTEYSGAMTLKGFREAQEHNQGLSFSSISSIGANGAVVHYEPLEHTAQKLNNKEVYLLDSGGQYLDGTTDVTRTFHFSEATDEQRDAYTRVLLGNLDVERVLLPNNGRMSGSDIDILARRRLWEVGLDYGHGTGHGVGYFLNVHEGPLGISKYRDYAFSDGMMVTNEPGYYKDGEFGIRIENILEIVAKSDGKWLQFNNLTMFPYERRLIKGSLLEQKDRDYINNYHQRVLETLTPVLEKQNDQLAIQWLKTACAPL